MCGKTAMYARVSSEQQAREGTIESQISAVREYIAHQGWKMESGSEYTDNGVSGTRLERPGLEELRDRIAAKQYQRVVVLSRDRLSRNFIHQEYLREEWEKMGCELVYVQEPSVETPEDLLASRVRGIFAEYERFALLDRTRRGQMHRARQGEPYGQAPWGYRYLPSEGRVGARWEVEAEAAHWVQQIFVWIGQEHLAIRAVARRLNEVGVQERCGVSRASIKF
jgi:site-specific DNA recombinase